jgi:predicted nuclease of restriction endonuclease-like (RecB) superfamily
MKRERNFSKRATAVYSRIRQILDSARTNIARTVNTTQVVSNWLIGREIVEEEQQGADRARYGKRLIATLSKRLLREYGAGYSAQNLAYFRQFYARYPGLLPAAPIFHAARGELAPAALFEIFHTARGKSLPAPLAVESGISHALRGELDSGRETSPGDRETRKSTAISSADEIGHTLCDQSLSAPVSELRDRARDWQPGRLHAALSWTHYRTLLRIDDPDVRAFYEIEAIANHWAGRELERQINSLLYERLALSKDKDALLQLSRSGQEIQSPADVFKDPFVIEFLGLPESPKLVETELEQALIDNLQAFLLELGKGFAFVARQERLTLEGDHFYIDLVFYHTILKCYVLIDLKTGKLTHQDLGQLQLYVNYYDHERRTTGDNPTLGLILCTDKNDTVVKYTLGPGQSPKIFASRYKLYLPSEAELREEILREVRALPAPAPATKGRTRSRKRSRKR